MIERDDLVFLRREFSARFGACRMFSAPGRVNLIGEHTDYNQGYVLPVAIERRTYVAGARRADRLVHVRSNNFSGEFTFDLDRPGPSRRGSWADYVEGTARALLERGFVLSGADLILSSQIPIGAGLSSSAALEISVAYALTRLSGLTAPDGVSLALSGQAAENEYVGARVGIMDQLIAVFARPDSALLIDCRSLERTVVPVSLGDARILICDTRVKHKLAGSAYNERREQCERGVELLRSDFPGIASLRDVAPREFERSAPRLPALIRRRCQHVIRENARTLLASQFLVQGRFHEFGALMIKSHESLRDDYEVSCAELDAAVEAASAEPGVYGARMTGGGFGGCVIALVDKGAVERVEATINARFAREFSIRPEFFVTQPSGGVQEHVL